MDEKKIKINIFVEGNENEVVEMTLKEYRASKQHNIDVVELSVQKMLEHYPKSKELCEK